MSDAHHMASELPIPARPADMALQLPPPPSAARRAVTAAAGIGTGTVVALCASGQPWIITPVLGLAALQLGLLARSLTWNRRVAAAVSALDEGFPAVARRTFEAMTRSRKAERRVSGTLHLARLELRTGHYDRALALYGEAHRAKPRAALARAAADGLAMTYALLGDQPAARAWLAAGPQPAEHLATATAVVSARAAAYRDVIALRTWHWGSALRGPVFQHEVRVFFLLRALSRYQAGASIELIPSDLRRAAPSHPHDYDYLTRDWPELAAFVAEHPLFVERTAGAELPRARAIRRM